LKNGVFGKENGNIKGWILRMGFWSILGPNFLAKQHNTFCRYLNRIMNSCFISPGCHIPKSINLTHGQVVIGSAKIGENVTIYQNTTLGGFGKKLSGNKRIDNGYPTIEDNVIIYANCIIIGKITIGKNSIIGAGSFINKNIPANTTVYNKRTTVMKEIKKILK